MFTITVRSRYQLLEDEGPEVAEDEEVVYEVVSICQVMEKTYTEIAKVVLRRAKKMRKKKKHGSTKNYGTLRSERGNIKENSEQTFGKK